MIADDNNSKEIDKNEFFKLLHDYRIHLSNEEKNELFNEFDIDGSGNINYEEFTKAIVGEMNNRRKNIVKKVFNKLDKNGNGRIEIDDIKDSYDASNHPDVKNGKKSEDEVLAEFLDNFEYHFNLLNNNKSRDGKITLDEFIEYYNNLSMSIDNDDYFEAVMNSAWDMDNSRSNNRQKAWRGDI